MSDEPKWLILLRDTNAGPWYVFSHPAGKKYRYASIDKANSSLKSMFYRRWQAGNAKTIREDQYVTEDA